MLVPCQLWKVRYSDVLPEGWSGRTGAEVLLRLSENYSLVRMCLFVSCMLLYLIF